MRLTALLAPTLAALAFAAAPSARADIHVGVIVSTTGPAASLGIPEEQTIRMGRAVHRDPRDELPTPRHGVPSGNG